MPAQATAVTAVPVPSPQQQAVLDFIRSGSGHGVVKATAGAGKTTTLVQVAHILPDDLQVCFLAFGRDAAAELKARLPRRVQARTVHSLGRYTLAKYLRAHGVTLQEPDKQKYRSLVRRELGEVEAGFAVGQEVLQKSENYLMELLHFARLNLTDSKSGAAIRDLAVRYNLRPPDDVALEDELHQRLRKLLREGAARARRGHIDFTDMLYVPQVLKLPPPQFDFVCVDEAQDYSALALEFTLRLTGQGGRLLFVGDPRQSIFGFAGADTDALDRIVHCSNATILPLAVTYRCPRAHVSLAKHIAPEIEPAPHAPEGKVYAIEDERLEDWTREDDLILCRYNAPLVRTCLRLVRARKRARVLGRDLATKLTTLATSLFKHGVANYEGTLRAYLMTETVRLEKRLKGQQNLEVLIAQLTDEVACLRYLLDDLSLDALPTLAKLEHRVAATFGEDGRAVVLSTVHRAKGKEATRVLILYPELMPAAYARTEEAIRGEACVQFVALTRATRDLVFVSKPQEPEDLYA